MSGGLVLDTGALIAFERRAREVMVLVSHALVDDEPLVIPAGVLAQAWRDGRRQARLARLLHAPQIEVVPLDDRAARAAGQLCGVAGTRDVVDASVVLCARQRGYAVLTSDPGDLRRLDPALTLVEI